MISYEPHIEELDLKTLQLFIIPDNPYHTDKLLPTMLGECYHHSFVDVHLLAKTLTTAAITSSSKWIPAGAFYILGTDESVTEPDQENRSEQKLLKATLVDCSHCND